MTTTITGNVIGAGLINSKINSFRTKCWKPQLLLQKESYDIGDCPIAVIEHTGFSPNKIINIRSLENNLFENTVYYHQVQNITSENNYEINYYPYNTQSSGIVHYLVTNYQSNNLNGSPLFLSYELMFDSTTSVDDIDIYKNGDTKIASTEYLIQATYDLLEDNITSRYDSSLIWKEYDTSQLVHRYRLLLPIEFLNKDDYYTVRYLKHLYNTTSNHLELIEVQSIYTESIDYNINEAGLSFTDNTRIKTNSTLMIIKDPRYRIYPSDILVPRNGDIGQSDQNSSWQLKLNIGSFVTNSGIFTNDDSKCYRLFNKGYEIPFPIVKSKPEQIYGDIIKVRETPIFLDETTYVYPEYKVNTYDETTESLLEASGKLSININGTTRTDIHIKSIDRANGYIQFNTELSPTDDIELLYYTDGAEHFRLDNLELNPKISIGSSFYMNDYPDGFGLMLRPYTDNVETHYPYIYDLGEPETERTCYLLYPKNPEDDVDGITTNWSGEFFTFATIGLNKLTKDSITITDARVIGGGIRDDVNPYTFYDNRNINHHEFEWYIDKAFWDGTPIPHGSLIIIHIPRYIINELLLKWENSASYEGPTEYRQKWARREVNFYIDRIIKKYISAGTSYILMDENFRFINLEV